MADGVKTVQAAMKRAGTPVSKATATAMLDQSLSQGSMGIPFYGENSDDLVLDTDAAIQLGTQYLSANGIRDTAGLANTANRSQAAIDAFASATAGTQNQIAIGKRRNLPVAGFQQRLGQQIREGGALTGQAVPGQLVPPTTPAQAAAAPTGQAASLVAAARQNETPVNTSQAEEYIRANPSISGPLNDPLASSTRKKQTVEKLLTQLERARFMPPQEKERIKNQLKDIASRF